MTERDTSPTSEGTWWLSNQGTPTGPHSEAFLLVGLKTGAVSPQTYACPVGSQEWKRLGDWPGFASICPMVPPPLPHPPQVPANPAPAPWDPQVIAWLGLLFTPVWAGIMAAINARRLRTGQPVWRPIVISVGATLADMFLVSDRFTYSIFPDVCLYLVTLWIVWHLDLRPQCASFASWRATGNPSGRWLWSVLAGSPLAIFVAFAFVVNPFIPLEPRQVCERFVAVSSLSEAKQYTSSSFWPALEAMLAQKSEPGVKSQFDLTGEEDAPVNVDGHLVGYRLRCEQKGANDELVEGFFHLRNRDGGWKIEDMFFTSINNQPTSEPVSIAANYQKMFPTVPPLTTEVPTPKPSTQSTLPNAAAQTAARTGWSLTRWLFNYGGEQAVSGEAKALASEGSVLARSGEKLIAAEGKGLAKGFGKGIGAAVVAILTGFGALVKSLLGGGNGSQATSKETSDASAS